jgi:hypothetical protein
LAKSKSSRPVKQRTATTPVAATTTAHPPAQNPTLLVASAALFGLWFVFLLIVALWG